MVKGTLTVNVTTLATILTKDVNTVDFQALHASKSNKTVGVRFEIDYSDGGNPEVTLFDLLTVCELVNILFQLSYFFYEYN